MAKILKLTLLVYRSYHGAAISLSEKGLKQTSNAILLLYAVTKALLFEKGSF